MLSFINTLPIFTVYFSKIDLNTTFLERPNSRSLCTANCGLLVGRCHVAQYSASNCLMNWKGIGRKKSWLTMSRNSPGWIEENYEKPQSMSRPRFEPSLERYH
jgi:hypothetical protein